MYVVQLVEKLMYFFFKDNILKIQLMSQLSDFYPSNQKEKEDRINKIETI